MTVERLAELRAVMAREGVDAYIIGGSDPHHSEYTSERWKTRQWISGFTGSAGLVVVTADKAGLWTDGRYYIQAGKELSGSGIDLFKSGLPETPDYIKWLTEVLHKGSVVGSNLWTTSFRESEELRSRLSAAGLYYRGTGDLLDIIWKERPGFPSRPVFQLDLKYAGKSREEKLEDIRMVMEELGSSWYLISSLPDIAWTLNLRGSDVDYNPLFISYLLIGNKNSFLFIMPGQISGELAEILVDSGIEIKDYSDLSDFISDLEPGRVAIDPEVTSAGAYALFSGDWEITPHKEITSLMKSVKNSTEIESLKNAMKKDGAALVKFMIWLEESWPKGKLDEISVSDKLEHFRSMQDGYMGLSFSTIAGSNDNGAVIHYSASPETAKALTSPGVLLLDSGAHYLDGTTDITRVLFSGEIPEELKHDYTLILKGHVDLAMARFPSGTKGVQLDILARRPLWNEARNYNHGTGHGVGFFLNVHEGPQVISPKLIETGILEGMLTSNEPGVYLEGKYGIRIENLVLAVKSTGYSSDDFLEFETVSLCPFERELIDVSLLDPLQIKWIDEYHRAVYEALSPLLDEAERYWLKKKTDKL